MLFFKRYSTNMKILKKIPGSFSSEVFLVEIEEKKFVLKRCQYIDEIITEKEFINILSDNNIQSLKYFENQDLTPNEILLEYVENSTILGDRFTKENCKTWGKLTKRMHDIKFDHCFKFNKAGKRKEITWSSYIEKKIKKTKKKAKENNFYNFNDKELKKINEYIFPLQNIKLNNFSLIHGDLHTSNVLIKNNELLLFDKNPEAFSGDPLIDLAIAFIDMPNGTLIKTSDPENKNDKSCLNYFIKGYGKNFLNSEILNKYIVLIAFGRLYTPYSKFYKAIILNIIK